jgi:hypothetical protein
MSITGMKYKFWASFHCEQTFFKEKTTLLSNISRVPTTVPLSKDQVLDTKPYI